jgi:hypothetical protein
MSLTREEITEFVTILRTCLNTVDVTSLRSLANEEFLHVAFIVAARSGHPNLEKLRTKLNRELKSLGAELIPPRRKKVGARIVATNSQPLKRRHCNAMRRRSGWGLQPSFARNWGCNPITPRCRRYCR